MSLIILFTFAFYFSKRFTRFFFYRDMKARPSNSNNTYTLGKIKRGISNLQSKLLIKKKKKKKNFTK